MKTLFMTFLMMCMCVLGYAQDRPNSKTVSQKNMTKPMVENSGLNNSSKSDGVLYGILQYKSAKNVGQAKPASQKKLIVILRDASSKKIIDVTTTDTSGKFMFKKMKYRNKGVELIWELASENGPIVDEWGCMKKLSPVVHGPPVLIEECDDSTLTYRLTTGYCICVTDPCPCASPLDDLLAKTGAF